MLTLHSGFVLNKMVFRMLRKVCFILIALLVLSVGACRKHKVLTDELARELIVGKWELDLAKLNVIFNKDQSMCFEGLYNACFSYNITKDKIILTRSDVSKEIAYRGIVLYKKGVKDLELPLRALTDKVFKTKISAFPISFSRV